MSRSAESWIEHPAIGRVLVPPSVPEGFRLFYTTMDSGGRIDDALRALLRPAVLSSCHQVHGATVCAAPVQEAECDALWSDAEDSALAIKVADCLPVSIIDPAHGVIANIHSGWRGTVQGITEATLDAAPIDPSSSRAFLGPTIRVCCFEVGEEVAERFDPRFVNRTLGPKPHVDVPAFTADVLRRRGFGGNEIIDVEVCTRCRSGPPLFHSYRRDKRSGRNLAIVAR